MSLSAHFPLKVDLLVKLGPTTNPQQDKMEAQVPRSHRVELMALLHETPMIPEGIPKTILTQVMPEA
jgi:hypothetical protein